MKTCGPEEPLCAYNNGTGVGLTGGCSGTFGVKVPGECKKKKGLLECWCDDKDGCNKKCMATDCKAATKAPQNVITNAPQNMITNAAQNGARAIGDEPFEKCTAKCNLSSTSVSKRASSIMLLATQAIAGFLILNMKMITM